MTKNVMKKWCIFFPSTNTERAELHSILGTLRAVESKTIVPEQAELFDTIERAALCARSAEVLNTRKARIVEVEYESTPDFSRVRLLNKITDWKPIVEDLEQLQIRRGEFGYALAYTVDDGSCGYVPRPPKPGQMTAKLVRGLSANCLFASNQLDAIDKIQHHGAGDILFPVKVKFHKDGTITRVE